MSAQALIVEQIVAERQRQDEKFGQQRNADGTGPRSYARNAIPDARSLRSRVNDHAKLGILTDADVLLEEVAEAFEETDRERLRSELVQVAAVAVRWIERLDDDARRLA